MAVGLGLTDLVPALAGAVGLGLAMAFSPTTFGIEVSVLASPQPRGVRTIAAAVASGALALCAVPLLVSRATIEALWHGEVERLVVLHLVDALVGVALVLAGMIQWRRAESPRPAPRRPVGTRPRVLFGVVLANTVLSTTGAATGYLVVRLVTGPGIDSWARPVVFAVFLASVVAPYLAVAAAWRRFPATAGRIDALVRRIEAHDWRRVVAFGLVAVGTALVVWAVSASALR